MKILVVGAGLSGAIVAQELANDHEVTVIDSRDHIAGNMHEYEMNNIRVHEYGPHIWHTNSAKAHDYMSKFTTWIDYKHKVKAILGDGTYVTLPVNKETKEIVGEENIIDTFIRPYTKKMWDKDIEELNPDILKRVPIRDDMNELYFPNDEFQGMPKDGYNKLIENMLDHNNITVKLETPFGKEMEQDYDFIFNSMPIDEYFDSDLGELSYRSIRFHNMLLPHPKMQSVPTVNFTNDGPFTRVTEWKNYPNHGVNEYETALTWEEPCDYKDNDMQRFYPVKDLSGENDALYEKYKARIPADMIFIGRLGLYQYLDMHQVVTKTLNIVQNFINKQTNNTSA